MATRYQPPAPGERLLLVDNQLPVALARYLAANGHASLHVRDLGMADSDDRAIWAHASAQRWVIVSKDEDFQSLALRLGPPPQVIWVRIGNCRKQALFPVFDRLIGQITSALDRGDAIVEVWAH